MAWSIGVARGVADAGLHAGGIVPRGEASLAAVVHGGGQRLEAHLRPAIDVAAHVLVEAEDFLDHDHPALGRWVGVAW